MQDKVVKAVKADFGCRACQMRQKKLATKDVTMNDRAEHGNWEPLVILIVD